MEEQAPSCCLADPNFAVIAGFVNKFGKMCGITFPTVSDLVSMLECKDTVPQELVLLYTQLLRRARRTTVSIEKWEKAAVKFCQLYSLADAANLEQHGFLNSNMDLKLRLLKNLLETQFDFNSKLKTAINLLTAEELRPKPIGRDEQGRVYWSQLDPNAQLRVYREEPDSGNEILLVAYDRPTLVKLLHELIGDDTLDFSTVIDSGADVKDTPVVDTGQLSDEDDSAEDGVGAPLSDGVTTDAGEMKEEDSVMSEKTTVPDSGADDGAGRKSDDKDNTEANEEDLIVKEISSESVVGSDLRQEEGVKSSGCSEAIEEPVMVVTGEGNGADCETGCPFRDRGTADLKSTNVDPQDILNFSFLCSEVVEEPVMYFFGVGSGVDCEVGNPDQKSDSENVSSTAGSCISGKSVAADSLDAAKSDSLSQSPNDNADPTVNEVTSNSSENAEPVSSSGNNDDFTGNVIDPSEDSGSEKPDSSDPKPKVWSINDICGSESNEAAAKSEETPISTETALQNYESVSNEGKDTHMEKEKTNLGEEINEPSVNLDTDPNDTVDSAIKKPECDQKVDDLQAIEVTKPDKLIVEEMITKSNPNEPCDHHLENKSTLEFDGSSSQSDPILTPEVVKAGEESTSNEYSESLRSVKSGDESGFVEVAKNSSNLKDCQEALRVPEIIITPNTPTNPVVPSSPLDASVENSEQGCTEIPDAASSEESQSSLLSVKKDENVSYVVPSKPANENTTDVPNKVGIGEAKCTLDPEREEAIFEKDTEDDHKISSTVSSNDIDEENRDGTPSEINDVTPECGPDSSSTGVSIAQEKIAANSSQPLKIPDTVVCKPSVENLKDCINMEKSSEMLIKVSPSSQEEADAVKTEKIQADSVTGEALEANTNIQVADSVSHDNASATLVETSDVLSENLKNKTDSSKADDESKVCLEIESELNSALAETSDVLSENLKNKTDSSKADDGSKVCLEIESKNISDVPSQSSGNVVEKTCGTVVTEDLPKCLQDQEIKKTEIAAAKNDCSPRQSNEAKSQLDDSKRHIDKSSNNDANEAETESLQKPEASLKVDHFESKKVVHEHSWERGDAKESEVTSKKGLTPIDDGKNVMELPEESSISITEGEKTVGKKSSIISVSDKLADIDQMTSKSVTMKEEIAEVLLNEKPKEDLKGIEKDVELVEKSENTSVDSEIRAVGLPSDLKPSEKTSVDATTSEKLSSTKKKSAKSKKRDLVQKTVDTNATARRTVRKSELELLQAEVEVSRTVKPSNIEEENQEVAAEKPTAPIGDDMHEGNEEQDGAKTRRLPERKSLRNRKTEPPQPVEMKVTPPAVAAKKAKTPAVVNKKEPKPSPSKKGKLSIVINQKESSVVTKKVAMPVAKKGEAPKTVNVKKKAKSKVTLTAELQSEVTKESQIVAPPISAPREEPKDLKDSGDIGVDVSQKSKSKKKKSSGKKKKKKVDREASTNIEGKASVASTEVKDSEDKDLEEGSSPRKGHYLITGNSAISREMKLLGLPLDATIEEDSGERSVRTSRRIAQIKIKEAEDRRREEEVTFETFKKTTTKPEKEEKKSKNKKKYDVDEDYEAEPEKEGKPKKKRKDHRRPWLQYSDSSSQEEEVEDYEEDEPPEEENIFKSDHEFSPESDMDEDPEYRPARRVRTARVGAGTGPEEDKYADTTCEACKTIDRPDWILLCDGCDKGWHTDCLKPVVDMIPEGEWFCPPCSHATLIAQLKLTLREFDRLEKQRENEELRKKRLAFVGISLDNVLPAKKKKETTRDDVSSSSDSESSSGSSGSGSTSESEPVYQLRERRTNVTSYRYNEYDEMIRSAIQDDVAPLVERSAREIEDDEETEEDEVEEKKVEKKETTPVNGEAVEEKKKENDDDDNVGSDKDDAYGGETEDDELVDEVPPVVPRNRKDTPKKTGKKKKTFGNLDFTSDEEDRKSDSDFKGASEESESEELSGSASSGGWNAKKRGPLRRSTRARRRRYDKDFINDDTSDDEEEDYSKKRKRREVCSDESSDSDKSWGGRGSKKRSKRIRIPTPPRWAKKKKKHKKSRRSDGSDDDKPKKRKIKFGGLDDSEDEVPVRKTRGKKMNYTEELGDDSEEEELKKLKKSRFGSDNNSDAEFVAEPGKFDEDEDEYVQEDDSEDSDDDFPIKSKKGKGAASPKGKSSSRANVIRDSESEPDMDLEDLDDEEEEKLLELLEKGDIPVDQLKAAVKRAKEEMKHKSDKPPSDVKESEKGKSDRPKEKVEEAKPKVKSDSKRLSREEEDFEEQPVEKGNENMGEVSDGNNGGKVVEKVEIVPKLKVGEKPKENLGDKPKEKAEEKPKRKNVKITPTRAELEAVKERERAEKAMAEKVSEEKEEGEKDHVETGGLLLRSLQGGPSPAKAASSSNLSTHSPLPMDELPATIPSAVTSSTPPRAFGGPQLSKLSTSGGHQNFSTQQPTMPRMMLPLEMRGPHQQIVRGSHAPQPLAGNRPPLQTIPMTGSYPRPGFQGPMPHGGPPHNSPPVYSQGPPGIHPQGFRPQGAPVVHSASIGIGQAGRSQSPQGSLPASHNVRGGSSPRPQGQLGIRPPNVQLTSQGPHGPTSNQVHTPPGTLLQQPQSGQGGHLQPLPGQQPPAPRAQLVRPPMPQPPVMQSGPGTAMLSQGAPVTKPPVQVQQSSLQGPPPASNNTVNPHQLGSSGPHIPGTQTATIAPSHQGSYAMSPQQNAPQTYQEPNFPPEAVKQRKKPGPKPGSKNKKKTEEEIQALAAAKGRQRGKKGDDVTIATVQAPTQFPDAVAAEGGSVITRMLNSPQGARPVQDQPNTRFSGAPIYHASHPMDPSPSGGAAVSVVKPSFTPENFSQYQNFQQFNNYPPEQSQTFQPPPFSEPSNFPPAQQPPAPVSQPSPAVAKQYDEESGGEFGGLASYFASQAEEDMDP